MSDMNFGKRMGSYPELCGLLIRKVMMELIFSKVFFMKTTSVKCFQIEVLDLIINKRKLNFRSTLFSDSRTFEVLCLKHDQWPKEQISRCCIELTFAIGVPGSYTL